MRGKRLARGRHRSEVNSPPSRGRYVAFYRYSPLMAPQEVFTVDVAQSPSMTNH